MSIQRDHGGKFYPKADQLRLDRPSTVTYDQMLRAQARTEDWLTAQGQYSVEAVREILDMIIERRVA